MDYPGCSAVCNRQSAWSFRSIAVPRNGAAASLRMGAGGGLALRRIDASKWTIAMVCFHACHWFCIGSFVGVATRNR